MFEKVKKVLSKPINRVALGVGTGAMAVASAMPVFAEANEGVTAAQTLLTAITGTLNITNAVAIISAGIGAVLGLFLAWWGARKLANMVVKVFRSGKIKF